MSWGLFIYPREFFWFVHESDHLCSQFSAEQHDGRAGLGPSRERAPCSGLRQTQPGYPSCPWHLPVIPKAPCMPCSAMGYGNHNSSNEKQEMPGEKMTLRGSDCGIPQDANPKMEPTPVSQWGWHWLPPGHHHHCGAKWKQSSPQTQEPPGEFTWSLKATGQELHLEVEVVIGSPRHPNTEYRFFFYTKDWTSGCYLGLERSFIHSH